MKTPYEGEPVKDGEYRLGQLSMPGYGRVVIPGHNPDHLLYNDMPVMMEPETFKGLFDYVKSREHSIRDFRATVKDQTITHVY
jgi:hypothetical protein